MKVWEKISAEFEGMIGKTEEEIKNISYENKCCPLEIEGECNLTGKNIWRTMCLPNECNAWQCLGEYLKMEIKEEVENMIDGQIKIEEVKE